MGITELNHTRIITVSLEDRGLSREVSGGNERVFSYLDKVSGNKSRITVEGNSSFGEKIDKWCSPQVVGEEDFKKELLGRLNGSSRQYSLGETLVDFDKRSVGKKTKRENAVKMNVQKLLDAHADGVDISNPYRGLLNIVVMPNTVKERTEQLFYMDQVLSFLKRFPPVEQISKERRKKIISDIYLHVWIGARGGVDDISRPHFSVNGNKFTHTSVLY